jgi:nitroimidazol reductase NimA-like FMN-containing flavoprotein (pyridoxamine 5'-phosphate oxidase superfamily)
MRRSDKEIVDRAEIDRIIRSCQVCRLGLSDDTGPYVVPMCFGYDGDTVYLHCATEGRKLDILRKHARVCLEFDIAGELVRAEQACGWTIKYESVIAFGDAVLIEDADEKREGLRHLMHQYAGPQKEFTFPDAAVERVAIIKVTIDQITGKHSV